jgi:hypothetical protein
MAHSQSGRAASTGVATASQPDEQLKAGVLRLPGVLMQSVTGIVRLRHDQRAR